MPRRRIAEPHALKIVSGHRSGGGPPTLPLARRRGKDWPRGKPRLPTGIVTPPGERVNVESSAAELE
jgi:hypothetical protein